MFKLFKPQLTFDDVANDETKAARAAINLAAGAVLKGAARWASQGDVERATLLRDEAADLRSLAITIPLDMIKHQ